MPVRPAVDLLDREVRWLRGEGGRAMQFAMRLVVAGAKVSGVRELVPIEMAHINSCHYSGRMSLDFAEFLVTEEATFSVPTHTNASLISCSSPWFRPADSANERDAEDVAGAARVMELYEQLGCSTMWTCAPYQQPEGRPAFGSHVVGSESNAVGFVNSVLGARTNKYGDLIDVAAALVGRVPLAGRHTDAGRCATHLFDLTELGKEALDDPNLPHLLGVVIGRSVGDGVAVVVGLDHATEDDLKAIAAGGAAAGGVELFHVIGVTPEAPTLEAATGGAPLAYRTSVSAELLHDAAQLLTSASGDEPLRAVCLGTPHFSVNEFVALDSLLGDRRIDEQVSMIVTTSRAVAAELALRGTDTRLAAAGVQIVLDTCSYYPPRPTGIDGLTLTNSAKWAYYAQGMLDVPVGFTSLERCVESAVEGRWVR